MSQLERATGRDIDGDGVIGRPLDVVPGYPAVYGHPSMVYGRDGQIHATNDFVAPLVQKTFVLFNSKDHSQHPNSLSQHSNSQHSNGQHPSSQNSNSQHPNRPSQHSKSSSQHPNHPSQHSKSSSKHPNSQYSNSPSQHSKSQYSNGQHPDRLSQYSNSPSQHPNSQPSPSYYYYFY
ncbi:unnamed protein product [Adineta steineri]|uniref:Uncharacterized protein n=1 Tax=Adineta steineri TaxID=433720 RepID=A0A819T2Y4_9BILA|nr:unnamed protein product [Adineta steineri]